MGFGSVLSIGASLLGGLGGGKKSTAAQAPQSGFAALPKAVQDVWLNTYMPDVVKNYNQPFQPTPMVRANAPTPIGQEPQAPMSFDSQEVHNLQKFSDAVGGFFSPVQSSIQQVYNPQPAAPVDPNIAKNALSLQKADAWLGRQYGRGFKPIPDRALDAFRFNPATMKVIAEELEKSPNNHSGEKQMNGMIDTLRQQGIWDDNWAARMY